MNPKNTFLMLAVIVALGAAAYPGISSAQPTGSQLPEYLKDKRVLSVDFPLKPDHMLYMEYDASIVPMGKLFDLEVSSRNVTQIQDADGLSSVTGQISTEEQALAFVKFFTSTPTKHLLETPFSGIEPSDPGRPGGPMPDSLTRLMTPASVGLSEGQWVVERDLLLYPVLVDQKQQTPARLVRSHETISPEGIYTISIGTVLAEGDEINVFLPYYL